MAGSRWSELPVDLVEMIDGNLGVYEDNIRFRCVCTHFMQYSSDLPHLRQAQPPWLLLPYRTGSMCGLYHPLENKVFDIDLPEAGDKVFKGTGHGWVVTLQLNGSIDVLNPLTRARVPLPPRYTFPDVVQYDPDEIGNEYVFRGNTINPLYATSSEEVLTSVGRLKKVVLSSSPLSDDFIAVALHPNDKLSYCKVGDTKWRYLVEFDEELDDTPRGEYHDVTFFGGKLYAVSHPIGELMVCDDFCCSCPRLRKCDNVSPFGQLDNSDCLTNSSDLLLMAQRFKKVRVIEDESHMDGGESYLANDKFIVSTTGFKINKLDVVFPKRKKKKKKKLDVDQDTTPRSYWVGKSLGDDEILFMGLGTQILISSQDFVGKGNRIYFASDCLMYNCGDVEDCFDNGVFNFEDKSIKPLGYECSPQVIWPSPIWFTPNPY